MLLENSKTEALGDLAPRAMLAQQALQSPLAAASFKSELSTFQEAGEIAQDTWKSLILA